MAGNLAISQGNVRHARISGDGRGLPCQAAQVSRIHNVVIKGSGPRPNQSRDDQTPNKNRFVAACTRPLREGRSGLRTSFPASSGRSVAPNITLIGCPPPINLKFATNSARQVRAIFLPYATLIDYRIRLLAIQCAARPKERRFGWWPRCERE